MQLGADLAVTLVPPVVVSLEGTLGAGKTQLTKGLVAGLGSESEASSPSFAIIHEYAGASCPIFHFDFYRLDEATELINAGYDDCLAEGVTIAEWGDKFPEMLPDGTFRLRFEIMPDDTRRIRGVRTL